MQLQHKYLTTTIALYKRLVLLFSVFSIAIQLNANNDWRKLKINFYDHELRFSISPDFFVNNISNVVDAEQQVKIFVQHQDVITFLNEATDYANQLKLDDVGFVLLVNNVAKKIKITAQNKASETFCYAVLALKGYDVLLGESENGLTVYGNTNVSIKNCLYVVKQHKIY